MHVIMYVDIHLDSQEKTDWSFSARPGFTVPGTHDNLSGGMLLKGNRIAYSFRIARNSESRINPRRMAQMTQEASKRTKPGIQPGIKSDR
jgi:hypothetical protein